MEKLTLIQQSGLSETKLNSELNRIGLLPEFEHLGISAASTTIPQEICNFILTQNEPKQLNGKISQTRKAKKSPNRNAANDLEMSIRSMSLDVSALDELEASEIEKQAIAIDNAREAQNLTQENASAQRESLINEGLIQAEIEGELSGELEGITYVQAKHRAKQAVLRDYSQFENLNHHKFVQAYLNKYRAINSEQSENIAKENSEYAEKNAQLRQTLLSKFKR